MSQQQKSPPIKEFRVGTIKAAIWRNEVQQGDRTVVQYSVKVQRSYYDQEHKEWKPTEFFFPADLPKLQLVAAKAFEFVSLNEEDIDADAASAGT